MTIRLINGGETVIDKRDARRVLQFKWVRIKGDYIQTTTRAHHYLHKYILSGPKGTMTDHINGNRLDNRRSNLRVCTPSQNSWNQKVSKNNTTGYKGISVLRGRYVVRIGYKGKRLYLGSFSNKKLAAQTYNRAAKKLYREFALLNKV